MCVNVDGTLTPVARATLLFWAAEMERMFTFRGKKQMDRSLLSRRLPHWGAARVLTKKHLPVLEDFGWISWVGNFRGGRGGWKGLRILVDAFVGFDL